MSLRFAGGERLQRGRGIGGILRLAKSVFSPLLSKMGTAAVSAVKSKTGQKAIKALKKQAIDSSLNLATDVLSGKNLKDSLDDEVLNVKEKSLQKLAGLRETMNRKRKAKTQKTSKKKLKTRKYQDILS